MLSSGNIIVRVRSFVMLFCLLTLPAWSQQAELSIELPDVDAAILATELLQTENAEHAHRMMRQLDVQLIDSCYGTSHYTYLHPGRVVRFTLTQRKDSPRLRQVSFAAPAVERLLPQALLRLGYRVTAEHDNCTDYRHDRLGVSATLDYDPVWQISSMTFSLEHKRQNKETNNNKTKKH